MQWPLLVRPQDWSNSSLVQKSHESFPLPDVALVEMQLLLPKVSLAVIQLLIGCFDLAAASLLQPHQRSQTLHSTPLFWGGNLREFFSRRVVKTQPDFVNVKGALESIPPAYVAMRACTSNGVVVPARQAGNRFLGSFNVHKYWLWILSKRFWSDQLSSSATSTSNQIVSCMGR